MVYVERNPVKAQLCRRAWDWRWSSAAVHCGQPSHGPIRLSRWQQPAELWQQALRQGDDEAAALVRLRTQTGRPLGSDTFLSRLEKTVGRRLRPLPVGRPARKGKE